MTEADPATPHSGNEAQESAECMNEKAVSEVDVSEKRDPDATTDADNREPNGVMAKEVVGSPDRKKPEHIYSRQALFDIGNTPECQRLPTDWDVEAFRDLHEATFFDRQHGPPAPSPQGMAGDPRTAARPMPMRPQPGGPGGISGGPDSWKGGSWRGPSSAGSGGPMMGPIHSRLVGEGDGGGGPEAMSGGGFQRAASGPAGPWQRSGWRQEAPDGPFNGPGGRHPGRMMHGREGPRGPMDRGVGRGQPQGPLGPGQVPAGRGRGMAPPSKHPPIAEAPGPTPASDGDWRSAKERGERPEPSREWQQMGHPMGPGARQASLREPGPSRGQHHGGDQHRYEGGGGQPAWMGDPNDSSSAKRAAVTAADVEAERQAMKEQFRKARSAPAPARQMGEADLMTDADWADLLDDDDKAKAAEDKPADAQTVTGSRPAAPPGFENSKAPPPGFENRVAQPAAALAAEQQQPQTTAAAKEQPPSPGGGDLRFSFEAPAAAAASAAAPQQAPIASSAAQPAAANAGEQPAEGAAQPRSRFQRYFKLEDSPSESPAPPAAATLQGAPPQTGATPAAPLLEQLRLSPGDTGPTSGVSPFAAVSGARQPSGALSQPVTGNIATGQPAVQPSPFAAVAQTAPQLSAASSLEQLLAGASRQPTSTDIPVQQARQQQVFQPGLLQQLQQSQPPPQPQQQPQQQQQQRFSFDAFFQGGANAAASQPGGMPAGLSAGNAAAAAHAAFPAMPSRARTLAELEAAGSSNAAAQRATSAGFGDPLAAMFGGGDGGGNFHRGQQSLPQQQPQPQLQQLGGGFGGASGAAAGSGNTLLSLLQGRAGSATGTQLPALQQAQPPQGTDQLLQLLEQQQQQQRGPPGSSGGMLGGGGMQQPGGGQSFLQPQHQAQQLARYQQQLAAQQQQQQQQAQQQQQQQQAQQQAQQQLHQQQLLHQQRLQQQQQHQQEAYQQQLRQAQYQQQLRQAQLQQQAHQQPGSPGGALFNRPGSGLGGHSSGFAGGLPGFGAPQSPQHGQQLGRLFQQSSGGLSALNPSLNPSGQLAAAPGGALGGGIGSGAFQQPQPQPGIAGFGGSGGGGGASNDLLRLLQQAGAAGTATGPPAPQLSLQDQLRGFR